MRCAIACTALAASYSIVNAVPLGEMESSLHLGKYNPDDETLIARDPKVAIWGSGAHVIISNADAKRGATDSATISSIAASIATTPSAT